MKYDRNSDRNPGNAPGNPDSGHADKGNADAGRAVLVGLLGGIVSAAGYLVYQRLPDDQKERLHTQVRGIIETRLNEIRQNFNI